MLTVVSIVIFVELPTIFDIVVPVVVIVVVTGA
jgi:hypothetical protein